MEWNDEKVFEFLDLYEKEPAIWDPKDRHHKNRMFVDESWKRIQRGLSIECPLNEIKWKKKILMASYRKCRLKLKSSKRNGQFYKPEWFAFNRMSSFLDAVYSPRRKLKKVEGMKDAQGFGEDDLFENSSETSNLKEPSRILPAYEDEENSDTPVAVEHDGLTRNERQQTMKGNIEVIEKRMREAYRFLKHVAAKPKVIKDESDKFCELLCFKLRSLDADSCRLLMHEINMLVHYFNNWRSLQRNLPHSNFQTPANQESVPNIMTVQTPITSSSHQNGSRDTQNERILKKFAVISFPDEEETLYTVASSWLEKTEESDFHICSWPPFKGDARIKLAVLENMTPSSTWSKCKARLIKQCSTYASAKELMEVIEIISNSRSEILLERKCKEIKKEAISSPSCFNSSIGSYSPSQPGPFICGVTGNVDESFYPTCSSTTSVEKDR